MFNKTKFIYFVLVLILIAGNSYFLAKNVSLEAQLKQANLSLESRKSSEQISAFARLFVQKVLKSDKEVDFESRLELENAVRGLDDAEMLDGWNKLVNSKDEKEAQAAVKGLLEMIVNKI